MPYYPPAGAGGSSNSAGLAGTGMFYIMSTAQTAFPNSRQLLSGSSTIVRTDGTNIYIDATTGGGSGTPGGDDSQVQINSQGTFAGFPNFRWVASDNALDLNTAGRIRHGGVAEVDGLAPTGVTGLLWLDTSSAYVPASVVMVFGTYNPVVTSVANLDAIVATSAAQYMQVGSTVNVSGRFSADPTAPATKTIFGLSLPVASAFTTSADVAGVAFSGNIAGMGGEVSADQTNDRAQVYWVSGDVTAQLWSYIYTYTVKV